ncbi:peptidase M50 [Actinomyces lilanjuaniae]|uniref:Peptidase M50 n=1 Tax=Actinomyces lilanjuaniae TaxID=2321394 RepID=A0ABN5PRY7_9ACTO|nr:site-2 protease family protein [Actinomyces lilanjuaniae]AYD89854.1 peptidase M50 [Actinomyces lilanjuaniae]
MPFSSTLPPARSGRSGEWVLGRVGGAPVVVSASSLLLGLLAAVGWYPSVSRALGALGTSVVVGVVAATVVGVALSVLLHELAHGLTGTLLGCRPVRYELYLWGGRTSFGRAASAWAPWKDALTSLSGPAANLLLWAGGTQVQRLVWEADGQWALPVYATAWALTWVNLALAVFNALPGLPLDGGHALAALLAQLTGNQDLGRRTAAWGGLLVVAAAAWWWVLRPLVVYGLRPGATTLVLVALVGWSVGATSWRVLGLGRGSRAAASLDLRTLARPVAVTGRDTPVPQVRSLLERVDLVIVADGPRLVGGIDTATLAQVGLQAEGSGAEAVADQVCTVLPPACLTTAVTGQQAAEAMQAARSVSRWLVLVESDAISGAVPTGAR